MGIRIEERFEVAAPPERVWAYLIDPARVVGCLPGAELVETSPDGGFVGRMRVKVGPVVAAYRGRARFTELDEAARRAHLTAEGQETGGAGSARMAMSSEVIALDGAGSAVRVAVDVEVVGKLAQFGRGMIEEVSRQMFRQFAGCVRKTLEGAAAAPAARGEPTQAAAGLPADGAQAAAGIPAGAHPAGGAQAAASIPAGPSQRSSPGRPHGGAPATGAPVAAAAPAPATSPPPLRVLPLLWAAFKAWLRRLVRGKRAAAG